MQRLLVWLTYSQSFDRLRIRKKFDRLIKYQKVSVALVITRLMFSRKIWWVKNSNNIGQDFIRRRFNQFAEKFNRIKSKIYGVWNRIAHKASARKYMVRVWFFLSHVKQPCAQNKFRTWSSLSRIASNWKLILFVKTGFENQWSYEKVDWNRNKVCIVILSHISCYRTANIVKEAIIFLKDKVIDCLTVAIWISITNDLNGFISNFLQ